MLCVVLCLRVQGRGMSCSDIGIKSYMKGSKEGFLATFPFLSSAFSYRVRVVADPSAVKQMRLNKQPLKTAGHRQHCAKAKVEHDTGIDAFLATRKVSHSVDQP